MFQQFGATLLLPLDPYHQNSLKSLLRGLSWLLLVMAGLAFWVGGRAFAEFAKTDPILGEMLGIGIAVVAGGTCIH